TLLSSLSLHDALPIFDGRHPVLGEKADAGGAVLGGGRYGDHAAVDMDVPIVDRRVDHLRSLVERSILIEVDPHLQGHFDLKDGRSEEHTSELQSRENL